MFGRIRNRGRKRNRTRTKKSVGGMDGIEEQEYIYTTRKENNPASCKVWLFIIEFC